MFSIVAGRERLFADRLCVMWNVHFVRRAIESLVLFRFSAPFVNVIDSVTEFAYYWIFAALIALYASAESVGESVSTAGALVWIIGECCNCCCHHTLASAPRGTKPKRARISRGRFLFDRVTCPHYFFEIVSWIGFNIASGFSIPGTLFMTAGAIIMTSYAIQTHENAPKTTKHTPLFPFLDIRPPAFVSDALAR